MHTQQRVRRCSGAHQGGRGARARFVFCAPVFLTPRRSLIIFPFPSSSLINVYKKAKAGAATLARKTKYTFKELTDKVETWSRRDRS